MASLQHMPQCSSHSNGIRSVMHSDPVRPGTPSFRIVSTPAVNPSPTFSDAFEEEEVLFEDVLSPKKLGVTGEYIPVIPSGQDLQDELDGYLCGEIPLFHMRQLSGYSDLSHVISLDLIVDTSESSLGSLGNYLPNIRELRLSGSRISSVRDLGTTLRSLQVLWMSRCGLQDLDGIGSIGTLRELYLSYNEISDVSPLSMVDTLELVDIESNNVDSLDQIEFLCMCPNLSTLNIEGNPVTSLMSPVELRKKICVLLPELRYLDDQLLKGQLSGGSLTTSSHPLLGNTGNLQSEISVVNTSLKDTMSEAQRRPKSAKLEREDTSSSIPSPTPSPGIPPDHSSGLTQGAVICGPPSKLRTKLTKNVKENIYSDILEKSAPPTPVGAWSEDPDEMLQEWKTSRDWLSRELTIDSVNEENTKSEKRANYEAALRETSRPSSSRKLSRPTSAARKSPTNPSPVPKSGKSRTPTFYDESVDVEERADKRVARDNHVPKKSAREQRVGSGSREQRSGSQDRRSGSQDRRSGSLDRRSIDRSKGKERLSKNELCVKQFRTTKTKKIS
ncbi:uncharacterized protein F09G8.5-like isoform X2 [Bolinopsis microptera]|uniref:uncharacterized protein F09G8.5-like isoform X2 n=1 Tax=Bolinopsis microptera TaxID=2820187 RepID=UPI00307A4B5A